MPLIKEDPLRRYDPTKFSFKSVKQEVSEASHFDWKRDKIDDAKKRAIHSVTCYDEFKDRVATCTLKPIHRNEFNAVPKKLSFNNHVDGSASGKPIVPLLSTPPKVDKVSEGNARGAPAEVLGKDLSTESDMPRERDAALTPEEMDLETKAHGTNGLEEHAEAAEEAKRKVEEEQKAVQEERRKAEARKAEEEARVVEETRAVEEAKRRAEEDQKIADEERRKQEAVKAEEEARLVAEAQAPEEAKADAEEDDVLDAMD